MYIRIKADWLEDKEKRECVITLSKLTPIEELRNLIKGEIDLEPKLQRLFYKGKELVDGQRLNDYSVLPNDVIVVMKRHIIHSNEDSLKPSCSVSKSEVIEDVTLGEKLIDAESSYYTVGDVIDVLLLDTGAWYEASITKILKNEADLNVDERKLIFRVKSEEHVSVIPFDEEVQFENIRPRSFYTYKIPDLAVDMRVLVNFNIDSPKERGFWYDFKITKVGSVDIIGTIFIGNEQIDNCNIKFIQEVMRIEEPKPRSEQQSSSKPTQRKYPYHCKKCRDDKNKVCKMCGCHICGGKNEWDKIILCDECDLGYHTTCLSPPVETIPDDDWYCPTCKTDDSEIVKAGEKLKLSKKKQKMPSNINNTKKDWGKGMACVGLTKTNDKVSKSHVGAIPGVEVGFCWKFRHGVAESGVHRPPVAGIHGQESDCAYSVVLSGGYEDDIDYGHEFLYTGAGGRDLSGNKRTSNQSFDQELSRTNKALALNCNAKIDDKKGAEANDWKAGKPVRVVRSYKLAKHSKFAPEDGYRYDGLYKVVKYYPEKGQAGFIVWRYLLRRDDPARAPWEKNAKQFDIIYPEGYLESIEAKRKKEEQENKNLSSKGGQKRKKSNNLLDLFSKKKKNDIYNLDSDVEKSIDKDTVNRKLWLECKTVVQEGKKRFLEKVEDIFTCIICLSLVFYPVTLKCGHNLCKKCLKESFKHCSSEDYTCPHCREHLGVTDPLQKENVNEALQEALNLLFPGYGVN